MQFGHPIHADPEWILMDDWIVEIAIPQLMKVGAIRSMNLVKSHVSPENIKWIRVIDVTVINVRVCIAWKIVLRIKYAVVIPVRGRANIIARHNSFLHGSVVIDSDGTSTVTRPIGEHVTQISPCNQNMMPASMAEHGQGIAMTILGSKTIIWICRIIHDGMVETKPLDHGVRSRAELCRRNAIDPLVETWRV